MRILREGKLERKSLARGLGILQVFISLSALAGGILLLVDSSGGKLGLPLELLEGSPFTDFRIPALLLTKLVGIGSLVGAVFSFRRSPNAGTLAMVLGVILMFWIAVQVAMIGLSAFLQPFYFVLGLLEFYLGWRMRSGLRA